MIRNHRDRHRGGLPDPVGNRREQSFHAAVNNPTISIAATWRERCSKERVALVAFLLCFVSGFVKVPADGLFIWVAGGLLGIALLRLLCRLLIRIGDFFVFPRVNGRK